jgi:hypothetical protein
MIPEFVESVLPEYEICGVSQTIIVNSGNVGIVDYELRKGGVPPMQLGVGNK